METEKTCPYCNRVHYSIYNVERCAALHGVSSESSNYVREQVEKRQKQMLPRIDPERRGALQHAAVGAAYNFHLPHPHTGHDA